MHKNVCENLNLRITYDRIQMIWNVSNKEELQEQRSVCFVDKPVWGTGSGFPGRRRMQAYTKAGTGLEGAWVAKQWAKEWKTWRTADAAGPMMKPAGAGKWGYGKPGLMYIASSV